MKAKMMVNKEIWDKANYLLSIEEDDYNNFDIIPFIPLKEYFIGSFSMTIGGENILFKRMIYGNYPNNLYYWDRWEAYYKDILIGYNANNEDYCLEETQICKSYEWCDYVLDEQIPPCPTHKKDEWEDIFRNIREELKSIKIEVEYEFNRTNDRR